MKLIVTGASGFCGTEIIRQAMLDPRITSVVALTRKTIVAPPSCPDPAKLRSVVVADYLEYPDDVRREFAGANACIWTVAITPTKSKTYAFPDVVRVCQESTLAGLGAMCAAGPATPFRFLYMSGVTAERDQTKTPGFMGEYTLMRGETENKILAFAASHDGVEAAAAKPGLMFRPGSIITRTASLVAPSLSFGYVDVIVAGMLHQVINGFEKDALMHEDLVRIAEATAAENKGDSVGKKEEAAAKQGEEA